jgi:hypothetical protein
MLAPAIPVAERMIAQTIAGFVFGLIPGAALGFMLICGHIRRTGGPERDRKLVRLAQLPFMIGPFLLIVASLYAILVWDFHPPEIGLTAGIAVGLIATYGFLYVYAVRKADRG